MSLLPSVAERAPTHDAASCESVTDSTAAGRSVELDAPAEVEAEVADGARRDGADVVVRGLDAERATEAPLDVRPELAILGEAGRDVRADVVA